MRGLLIYFGCTCFFSWILWLPHLWDVFGIRTFLGAPITSLLGSFGPACSAILVLLLQGDRGGVQRIVRRCVRFSPVRWLVIAAALPLFFMLSALSAQSMLSDMPFDVSGVFVPSHYSVRGTVLFLCASLVSFGFGEEIGWRGFALVRLQRRFNGLVSSLLIALAWSCTQIPVLIAYWSRYPSGPVAIGELLLTLTVGSVLLSWLFNSSRGSLLACALFHGLVRVVLTGDCDRGDVLDLIKWLLLVLAVLIILVHGPDALSRDELITS